METRRLGRLDRRTSVLVYGGAALGELSVDVADRSIQLALDAGIDHFDTAAGYGDSELHLGRWMPRIRDRVFLATKTGDREAGPAYDSIRRSLERLRVDRVDLIQHHAVCDLADLDRVTGVGGALEGAIRAQDEGLVGAIGITGHGMGVPAVHLEALRRFPFASVITPYSYRLVQDETYRRDIEELFDEVRAQDVALRVIKSVARNLWRTDEPPGYATWYEPMDEQDLVSAAVAFALDRPEVAGICTAGDVRLLPLFIEAERVRRDAPPDPDVALAALDDYEPPFARIPGRTLPDWLEYLVP